MHSTFLHRGACKACNCRLGIACTKPNMTSKVPHGTRANFGSGSIDITKSNKISSADVCKSQLDVDLT